MHKLDRDYAQRTIDFLTGVVFALDGKIQKIGQNVILCSPAQIGVQGQINLGNPDDFDEEILSTINKFFENSLNVSETSRQLYIHRNTLVYRLDKLQKSTGLDLRVFEDAITFKIALMVVKYMK